jgi:hypothetical protein
VGADGILEVFMEVVPFFYGTSLFALVRGESTLLGICSLAVVYLTRRRIIIFLQHADARSQFRRVPLCLSHALLRCVRIVLQRRVCGCGNSPLVR